MELGGKARGWESSLPGHGNGPRITHLRRATSPGSDLGPGRDLRGDGTGGEVGVMLRREHPLPAAVTSPFGSRGRRGMA